MAGLVLVGIGLLGVGVAIGMFFPWTGKEKINKKNITLMSTYLILLFS